MTITDDSGEKTGDSGEGPLDIQKSFFTIHFSEERQREKERKKTQRKSRGARIGISKSVGKMIRISQQPEIRRKYSSGTGCRGRPVTWRVTHGPDGIRGTGKVPRVRVVSSLGWFKAGCCLQLGFISSTMSRALIQKHPLQRLHSPSRGISALVHVC